MQDPAFAELDRLQERLEHVFRDPTLLTLALTHRSWCAENEGFDSNERLEFLGDAVLGMVVTGYIFGEQPELPEGAMAKARSAVVSSAALEDVALELDLGRAVRLGRGEEATGGRSKQSILADALEAVFGAVFLDGGWVAAQRIILGLVTTRIASAVEGPGMLDYKTRLQELAARRLGGPPTYEIKEEGPDHAKWFTARVLVGGRLLGEGTGRSKKVAQQAAAHLGWREASAWADEVDIAGSHGGLGAVAGQDAPA